MFILSITLFYKFLPNSWSIEEVFEVFVVIAAVFRGGGVRVLQVERVLLVRAVAVQLPQ